MKLSSRSLSLCALMTALSCILSCIGLPAGSIPFTLQTFAAALTGCMLRPKEAFFSMLAYLLLGACGLPVFSMLRGGAGMLIGPTGGFLIGLPFLSLLCACAAKKKLPLQMLLYAAGLTILYLLGVLHLQRVSGIPLAQAVASGVLPFVIKDILSLCGAALAARALRLRLRLFA